MVQGISLSFGSRDEDHQSFVLVLCWRFEKGNLQHPDERTWARRTFGFTAWKMDQKSDHHSSFGFFPFRPSSAPEIERIRGQHPDPDQNCQGTTKSGKSITRHFRSLVVLLFANFVKEWKLRVSCVLLGLRISANFHPSRDDNHRKS